MNLIYIANIADHVDAADASGVDRIMVDLEIIGKRERQGHLDTVVSRHSLNDVGFVRERLAHASLMVRINPIFPGSAAEIEAVVGLGADTVMLPMFKTVEEVTTFVSLLRGRCKASLLLETSQALGRAEQILSVPGIDEVHIGLNDLHLALGLDFMFEVLSGGLLDHLARICQQKELAYGFGGIARLGQGLLPAESILLEHVRLGSTQVILSRDFHGLFDGRPLSAVTRSFSEAVRAIRQWYATARETSPKALLENRLRLVNQIAEIAGARRRIG